MTSQAGVAGGAVGRPLRRSAVVTRGGTAVVPAARARGQTETDEQRDPGGEQSARSIADRALVARVMFVPARTSAPTPLPAARPAAPATDGATPRGAPAPRRGAAGTSRTNRRTSRRCRTAATTRALASVRARSKYIARPYMSEWYAPRGERPARLVDLHHRDGGRHGDRDDAAARAGVAHEALERLAHRAEPLGADVVRGRAGARGGLDRGVGEIVGVDELVEVVAAAEHRDVLAPADPLEEDLHDPQAPVAHDGARADDGDVEAARDEVVAEVLGGELRAAVVLLRVRAGVASSTGLWSGAPKTALDDMLTTLRTLAASAASSRWRAPSRLTLQNAALSFASGTIATLWWTTLDALDRAPDRGGIADVAAHHLDVGGALVGVVDVEDAHARGRRRAVARPAACRSSPRRR